MMDTSVNNDDGHLLTVVAQMRRDRPEKHAVVLDLSNLLHIDEPVFRRTLLRWLAGDDRTVDVYELGHARVVMIIPNAVLGPRREAMAQMATLMGAHRRGLMTADWYDLRLDGEKFATHVQSLVAADGAERFPDAPPGAASLERFLQIERTLHAVDVSSLLRENVVYRLDDDGAPQPVMVERTISIQALDRLFGTNLLRTPWLYDKVTSLLDRRMLFDLLRDHGLHEIPLAIKLHSATVAGEEFRGIIARFPARLHGKLIVELPFLEWTAVRPAFQQALQAARLNEIAVALDHVPMSAPSDTEMPRVDWYRIPWVGDDAQVPELGRGIAWMGPVDKNRCILTRCTSDAAIAAARAVGIRHVEGSAVDRMARDGARAEAERAPDRRTGTATQAAMTTEMDETVAAPRAGLWTRLKRLFTRREPPPAS